MVLTTSSKYSLPLFMPTPSRLLSLRVRGATPYVALLTHQHDWPCELPRAPIASRLGD
jgi:hypothetical protein